MPGQVGLPAKLRLAVLALVLSGIMHRINVHVQVARVAKFFVANVTLVLLVFQMDHVVPF